MDRNAYINQSRMMRRLLKHHALLATLSIVATVVLCWLIGLFYNISGPTYFYFRLGLATGYVSLALLIAALAFGPLNILRGKINPISTDVRRDTGIWCGVVSIVHFIFGWNVHMRSRWHYFFDEAANSWDMRKDFFGIANYTGLLALLLVALLLAISSDRALRKLGGQKWKNLQRLTYALALLVFAHSALYQLLENRQLKFVAFFLLLSTAGLTLQMLGVGKTLKAKRG
jgi:sulfoxide reductase heme-binding subunit YedZ